MLDVQIRVFHYLMKKKIVSNHYISACLTAVEKAGLDTAPLLESAAISPELIDKPSARITEEQLANLIKAVWRTLGDEFMGLSEKPCKNGVFALMMESLFAHKTLGAILQQSFRFYNAVQDNVVFKLETTESKAYVTAQLTKPEYDPNHLLQEFILLMWQRLSCWLVNSQLQFHSTSFNYEKPVHVTEYPSMFGGNLLFGQETSGYSFNTKLLSLPLARDPYEMDDFLRASPLQILRRVGTNTSVSLQVRKLIIDNGLEDIPSLEEVADHVHMTSRTLRRKLKEEGTSYQQIKDKVRSDTAIRYLTEEQLSIAETSHLIGFTEQAAFCRAFKNWTGVAPSNYTTSNHTTSNCQSDRSKPNLTKPN